VGGGVSSLEDIRRLLSAGADKVSINTAAVKNPQLIYESAKRFGSQCIVVAIDAKRSERGWEVYIHGGRTPTGLDAVEWAKRVESLGSGGNPAHFNGRRRHKKGLRYRVMQGCSVGGKHPCNSLRGRRCTMEHFYEVFTQTNVDAALAASLFHFKEVSIPELKAYLKNKGVHVRL
jgi:cyclase